MQHQLIKILIYFIVVISYKSFCYCQNITYPIVETGIHSFYNNTAIIFQPSQGNAFYGQDASYQGNEPSYTDNGDGTISDNVTGLMWEKNMGLKLSYNNAFIKADTMTLGGFTDWRIPSIKELYSLILFTGKVNGMIPYIRFIDTNYFNQPLGDTTIGERLIDAQTWSSTHYKGLTMDADSTIFGVNFVDGRIKGYPKYKPGSSNTLPSSMYFRMVRGNTQYGINQFVNNGDGTITDNATGLMWQQSDDGNARDWENALLYAENLTLAGYSDWRLPNAKELQSIVDYTRCPSVTNSPAIDSIFATTMINDPNGNPGQYPYFWSGTTHLESSNPYSQGVYVAFGKALGKINGVLKDVHGAGSQRSDPKTGNVADYPQYMGPQGDARIVFNFTRCVRGSGLLNINNTNNNSGFFNLYPNPLNDICYIRCNKIYEVINMEIFDISGRCILRKTNYDTQNIQLNISCLSKGIYILKLTSEQQSGNIKFMI